MEWVKYKKAQFWHANCLQYVSCLTTRSLKEWKLCQNKKHCAFVIWVLADQFPIASKTKWEKDKANICVVFQFYRCFLILFHCKHSFLENGQSSMPSKTTAIQLKRRVYCNRLAGDAPHSADLNQHESSTPVSEGTNPPEITIWCSSSTLTHDIMKSFPKWWRDKINLCTVALRDVAWTVTHIFSQCLYIMCLILEWLLDW